MVQSTSVVKASHSEAGGIGSILSYLQGCGPGTSEPVPAFFEK